MLPRGRAELEAQAEAGNVGAQEVLRGMEELRRLVPDLAADETATLERREPALKAAIAEQREAGIEISATTCDTRWRRIRHGDMTDSIENPHQLFDIRKLDARWTHFQAVWGGYVAPNLPGQADTLVLGDPDTPSTETRCGGDVALIEGDEVCPHLAPARAR